MELNALWRFFAIIQVVVEVTRKKNSCINVIGRLGFIESFDEKTARPAYFSTPFFKYLLSPDIAVK
jgi:hypothetical protein